MLKLITVLTSGIPAIISAVIAFIARKAGTAAATVASFIFLTAAFIACINTILQTLLVILTPPTWIANSLGLFIPANFTAVLSAIVSARICSVAYDLAMLKVKAINNAN